MTHYALDNAWQEARQRIALLEAQLDPATRRYLLAAGVGAGWQCLEVGAGGGSIAHWLCEVVGPTGRVVATDIDTRLAAIDAPPGLELLTHDLTREPLPAGAFDLVHARWLLHHLPDLDAAIARLVGALKPGGLLLIEEPDFYPVAAGHAGAPPLYARFMDALTRSVVEHTGRDCYWARGLPTLLARHPLRDVQAAAEVAVLRGGQPLARFYRLSAQQARARVLAGGRLSTDEFDAALRLLDDPALWAFAACTVSAWGRRTAP
jgi:SAM-dependent methyltransferase